RLDVDLAAADPLAGDGRLVLAVSEGELWGGKVSIRDLAADVPIRRGEAGGEPPWGKVALGELIGYGVVVRDLTTPARVWRDRLRLNDIASSLYSGTGKGWAEVELQPTGVTARGELTGEGIRIEEFMTAYGVRGGTMTGLVKYSLDFEYRNGRLVLNGHFEVPEGGGVNIELLHRVMDYVESDRAGVAKQALSQLRQFDYKHAEGWVRSAGDEIYISLALQGRGFLIFPPKVQAINIDGMPLSFLSKKFPGI